MSCDCNDLRAILALLALNAKHYNSGQWSEYGSLFTEDGVLHVFGRDYVGRDAIARFSARRDRGKHMMSTPIIEIDGDSATVSVDHVFFRYPDLVLFGAGTYEDDLVKVNGEWKFARREIVVHGHHPEMTAVSKQEVAPIGDTV